MSIDDIAPQPENTGRGPNPFHSTLSKHERPLAEKLRLFPSKDGSKTAPVVTALQVKAEPTDLLPSIIPPKLTRYLIPWSEFVAESRGQVQHVVAAVIVMHHGHTAQNPQYDVRSVHSLSDGMRARDLVPRTLLVKRSWFDYMGTLWEVSGGSADKAGDSILQAAARELREETGLCITKLIDVVEDDHEWDYENEKTKKMEKWRKFTFLAEAATATISHQNGHLKPALHNSSETWKYANGHKKGISSYGDRKGFPIVTLDPNEHEDYVWASEEEVRRGSCHGRTLEWTTAAQKAAILRAFDIMKSFKGEI